MALHYEVVVWARVPQASAAPTFTELDRVQITGGEASGGGGLSWSHELYGDGLLTISTDPTKLPDAIGAKLLNLPGNPMEMGLYRDGVLVQRGPIVGWQVQGKTLNLLGRGLLYYLRYMRVTSTLTYNSVAQGTIVKGLIDHHQSKSYGNFGLVTSTISATAVTRTREYEAVDLININDEIREMAEATDGFDILVDPSTRNVTIASPTTGTNKADSVILDERGIASPSVSAVVTATQFGTAALVAGINKDGVHYSSEQIDTTARNAFGLAYVSHSVVGVKNQAELNNVATQTKNVAKTVLAIPPKEFDSITGAGYDDFKPGDTISVEYDAGFGRLKVDARVKNQFVAVQQNGAEKLTVELV